jgi:hypothetical protein
MQHPGAAFTFLVDEVLKKSPGKRRGFLHIPVLSGADHFSVLNQSSTSL